jgi:hypothetical protein
MAGRIVSQEALRAVFFAKVEKAGNIQIGSRKPNERAFKFHYSNAFKRDVAPEFLSQRRFSSFVCSAVTDLTGSRKVVALTTQSAKVYTIRQSLDY